MKLELGKFYKTRLDRKMLVAFINHYIDDKESVMGRVDGTDYPITYGINGKTAYAVGDSEFDVIDDWIDKKSTGCCGGCT